MRDLIISFIAAVVFCFVMGGGILLLNWLSGIFGTTVIIPIFFFVLLWICAYCALKE